MLDLKVLDALTSQIAVVDRDGLIVATNRGWRETATKGHLADKDWNYLNECDAAATRGCEEATRIRDGIRDVLSGQREAFSAVYACPFDHTPHWFKLTVSRVTGPGVAILVHTDVTELQVDPLTGLPNRASFDSHLGQTLRSASLASGTFGIALVDVDGFKNINDRLGHAAGDAVLQQLASALEQAFRKQDFVARIGGDEFAAILAQGTSPDTADWLRLRVEAAIRGGRHTAVPNLTASVGLSFYPDDGRSAEELMRAADDRMYGAKRRTA